MIIIIINQLFTALCGKTVFLTCFAFSSLSIVALFFNTWVHVDESARYSCVCRAGLLVILMKLVDIDVYIRDYSYLV